MKNTSAAYSPYALVRTCGLKVSFRLTDTGAAGDAVSSATGAGGLSQVQQTHDNVEALSARYAGLELGGWILDGGCKVAPNSVLGLQTGFWSAISLSDRSFEILPSLTYEFAHDHSSLGFTVFFVEDLYAEKMTVDVYELSGAKIGHAVVTVTGNVQAVDMPVSAYRRVVLTFPQSRKPLQRIKIAEVVFGLVENFTASNVKSASITYEVSPTAQSLPSHELNLTIDNTDKKFNVGSPNSLYSYLQQGQILDTEIELGVPDGDMEPVSMGKFFYSSSKARPGEVMANIISNDPFIQLDKNTCKIGTEGAWTMEEAVVAVLTDSGLDITVSIPANIGTRVVNKCIPNTASHREALRLIAQAARCTCYFNRDSVLVFKDICVDVSVDELNDENMYTPAGPEDTGRINTVALTVGSEVYTASNIILGETIQPLSVYNPLAYNGALVANWLLEKLQLRIGYSYIKERGNPAREISDTLTMEDYYSTRSDVVVVKEKYLFSAGLTCQTWAVRT